MKRYINTGFIVMLSLVLMSTTCSTDDDGITNNNTLQIQSIVNIAQSGTWKITYFFDTDEEETSNYNDYDFIFASDGNLTASNLSSTITGNWSVTDDSNSSNDSNEDDDIDFNISFSSPAIFQELTDDWDIVSVTETTIELIDISGGNGGTDYLTFEKN